MSQDQKQTFHLSFKLLLMKSLKHLAKYLTPVPLKKALKYGYHSVLDIKDTVTGTRQENIPPRRLNFVGSEDFLRVSKEFFGYFTDPQIGAIQPHYSILDIGSGVGRMALPFLNYLSLGSYYGFDIDKRGVEWCQEHLTKAHSNFHFEHVDLFNKYYNPKGQLSPYKFRFPYADQTFDFVFATSVFTHLLSIDTQHYLEEIYRVLKPGGRALVTFFLLDEIAQQNIHSGKAACDLQYKADEYSYYSHKNVPEAEIGYLEDWIRLAINQAGLKTKKIYYGGWSGRENHLSYQDILLLEKPSSLQVTDLKLEKKN